MRPEPGPRFGPTPRDCCLKGDWQLWFFVAGAYLALDAKVILTPPCTLHQRFFIQNIQKGVRMTLTSTPRPTTRCCSC
jgi:hypothetical protein